MNRPRWGQTFGRNNDIELGQLDVDKDLKRNRYALLRVLFGIDERTASLWPGVELYLIYVEQQFKLVEQARFEPLWRALGFQLPVKTNDGIKFVAMVASACQASTKQGLSVDEILRDVIHANSIPEESLESASSDRNRQAIFTVIAWLTMMVHPSRKISDNKFHIIVDQKVEMLQDSQNQGKAVSPIFSLLRGFGCQIPNEDAERAKERDESSDLLQISNLNFFILKTVGKVNIRWTTTLSSHLAFHERTRTLSLFCFPTFCALHIIAESQGGSVFDR